MGVRVSASLSAIVLIASLLSCSGKPNPNTLVMVIESSPTNLDPRIIRCSTLLNGYYLENGSRHSVSDRQGVTIFPGKQQSAGRWVGMDQTAGATYKVACRAVS